MEKLKELISNINAIDPIDHIRQWMVENPEEAALYGENNLIY